jgi:hypothetical protein
MNYFLWLTYIATALSCLFFIVLTIISTVGGYFDLRYLFKSLNEEIQDDTDDGRVTEQKEI